MYPVYRSFEYLNLSCPALCEIEATSKAHVYTSARTSGYKQLIQTLPLYLSLSLSDQEASAPSLLDLEAFALLVPSQCSSDPLPAPSFCNVLNG
jgi:hypothetical protein